MRTTGNGSMKSGPAEAGFVDAGLVIGRLLAWYGTRDRHVPWRGETDPYRVWIGEVMAQQTRIGTVATYYERFLERFPALPALAAARLDEVLKAWEGMGYYGRARRLHLAAREVMAKYGGDVPDDPAALRALPGIGPYTAGAIASLAFGRAEPAIDGNVRRVLSRLFDLELPDRSRLEAAARELLASGRGDAASVNQALMDLGSDICRPRNPACEACPLGSSCLARARGTVESRPPPRARRSLPHQHVGVGVVRRGELVLIAHRPESGLLGGLWEFPGGKVETGESPADAVRRELMEEIGIEIEVGDLIERVDHAYSHLRVTLHFHAAVYVAGDPQVRAASEARWVDPKTLGDYAFPAASHSIVSRLSQ